MLFVTNNLNICVIKHDAFHWTSLSFFFFLTLLLLLHFDLNTDICLSLSHTTLPSSFLTTKNSMTYCCIPTDRLWKRWIICPFYTSTAPHIWSIFWTVAIAVTSPSSSETDSDWSGYISPLLIKMSDGRKRDDESGWFAEWTAGLHRLTAIVSRSPSINRQWEWTAVHLVTLCKHESVKEQIALHCVNMNLWKSKSCYIV